MKLTYRGRRRLQKLGRFLLWATVICLVALVCWLVWLERYVVYSADGATLRLDQPYGFTGGVAAEKPPQETVAIHYNEGENKVNTSTELTRLTGAYVTTNMLRDSIDGVDTAIQALPRNSAVMLDLKSIYGNFYYSTGISGAPIADQVDSSQVDALIRNLARSDDYYLIARIPAFRDRAFGLENTNYGLPTSKGYLWSDEKSCYWLDPTSNGALSYLISIATELRDLGFDEVVFTEFRIPNTSEIVFKSSLSRPEAIAKAAQILVTSCATEQFCVSFETDDDEFTLPTGRSRLYLTGVSAARAQTTLEQATVPVKETQLVFVTETNDTRYDIASVLRQLTVLAN